MTEPELELEINERPPDELDELLDPDELPPPDELLELEELELDELPDDELLELDELLEDELDDELLDVDEVDEEELLDEGCALLLELEVLEATELELGCTIGVETLVGSVMPTHPAARAAGALTSSSSKLRRARRSFAVSFAFPAWPGWRCSPFIAVLLP